MEAAARFDVGDVQLDGDLAVPPEAVGLVIFAHGSGSSRHSPRNRHVAAMLREEGLGTLLVDLLSPEEEVEDLQTRALRFDIRLLARRVAAVVREVGRREGTSELPIGLFGASTGAAAALVAAAEAPEHVGAVVSRGGRPDLAGDALRSVRAPTLLVVGGADQPVIEMNRNALARITAEVELRIVPGATHLFPEPGALDEVARLARDWFTSHLQVARV